ncbi:hypothetical protein SDC9_162303 [bioreactor metagenome]|uniref:Uncharacterized protein n=1 Tax=bioreactor metagenome TaxID=1076179 RepID=A0A645FS11_9ZZZZ
MNGFECPLVGGKSTVGGIHSPILIDIVIHRQRADNPFGGAVFRFVQIVPLQTQRTAGIHFIFQERSRLIEGDELQVVIEKVASH